MTYTPYVLPKFTLQGSPYEIGKQYGELARVQILLHLATQKSIMVNLRPDQPDWWQAEVKKHLPVYEEMAPHFVEEMHGLAHGADLDFDDVLLLNIRDELFVGGRPATHEGCTSFGCSGSVTLDGAPILGQTKDPLGISRDLFVVISMRQQGRPDLLQMPYAGEFGVFGVSSTGMACFGNSIYVRGRGLGRIPWSLFRRLVLESASVEDVIALVRKHGITAPGSLTVGDGSGRTIAVENTDLGPAIVEAKDGMLVHTNHIDSHLSSGEIYDEPFRTGSRRRQQRLIELLEGERGRLTAPTAMRFLGDHSNYPLSICRHLVDGSTAITTAALVVEPKRLLLHAIRGLPCRGWPATYTL
jgi:isopenicillin-N N-acyltransferase like protein